MKRYFLLTFVLMVSTWGIAPAQDIEMKVETRNSTGNEFSSDIIITIVNGIPDIKVYLYDFDKPSWKGGKPIQSVIAGISEEVRFADIPLGKYYVVAEDAENNATIKLIDLKANILK